LPQYTLGMKIGKLIIKYKWLREVLLFLFLLLVTFLNEREDFTSDHGWIDGAFVFIFLYLHLQFHRFFILPLLDKGKYLLYIICSIVGVLIFTALALVSDSYFTNVGWYDELEGESIGYLVRFYLFSFAMTIPLLIAIHSIFKQFDAQLKKEQDKVLLRDMELNLLKEQTNPHFLFNALNSLYGLSLEKPTLLPDKILQLSTIMRYNVEWSSVTWITLKQEIAYLKQYIDFEAERKCNYVQVTSTFDTSEAMLFGQIAPMLLVYFVENAFKHVRKNDLGCFIHIQMSTKGNTLLFIIENTYATGKQADNSLETGIENVKKRLEILYPDAYELQIKSINDQYAVHLKLKIRQVKN